MAIRDPCLPRPPVPYRRPRLDSASSGTTAAAPSTYAPSSYAPSSYAPSGYAPSSYAPSSYAPSSVSGAPAASIVSGTSAFKPSKVLQQLI